VSFGNVSTTQKKEAEKFETSCFSWGEFLQLVSHSVLDCGSGYTENLYIAGIYDHVVEVAVTCRDLKIFYIVATIAVAD